MRKRRQHKGFSETIARQQWSVLALTLAIGVAIGWWVVPPYDEIPEKEVSEQNTTVAETNTESELMQRYHADIYPMLEQYCYECHMDGSDKGGLDLDAFADLASIRENPKVWEHVLARVDYHLMPPPEEEQPDKASREKLITWINDAVFPVDPANPKPGRIVIRRMNQIEYQNTIRDLLGTEIDASETLPPDDSGYGFDNIGSVLTVSPAHVEKYLEAAELALNKVLVMGPAKASLTTLKPTKFHGGGRRDAAGIYFHTRDRATISSNINRSGEYLLHVNASAQQAGDEAAQLDVHVGDKKIASHPVKNIYPNPKRFTTRIKLKSGRQNLGIGFPNDFYDPGNKNRNKRDRNLMVHSVQLEGPTNVKLEKPELHRRIFISRNPGLSDNDYAQAVLKRFAQRAFRRPASNLEIDRYLSLVRQITSNKQSLEAGIYTALQAMLVSPSFLYIAPPENQQDDSPSLVSEHALASRLSYFLWSSMPDAELLKLANEGKLRDQLDSQVLRMLKSDKAKEMIRHFSGQWLQLRDLEVVTPDRKRFPTFRFALARDMRTETEMLVDHILRGNLNLMEFLEADYSFINERLAQHYGIKDVKGQHFRKVGLEGTNRRGMLTHASLLTLTSQPTRTSPVLRGKFVLENILDITPPPPPPDLPQLEEAGSHGKRMTLRQELELHRKKTACAGCHNLMDPVGLAFEHFDAIGRFREFDNGRPIDASGKLVTGEKLENAESLRQVIATNKSDEFLRCLISKMLTYSLGRGVDRKDRVTVENILRDLKENEYHAHGLILGIVNSVPFQQQGVEE